MSIEGELIVRIRERDGRVSSVESRTERPSVAPRLLPGRRADEAPGLLASLFAICGRSQSIAASAAIEAARNTQGAEGSRAERERRIAAETLQEAAWRFLVDYPRLLGREPHAAELAEGRRLLAPLLGEAPGVAGGEALAAVQAWAGRAIFGMPAEAFLAQEDVEDLLAWGRAAPTAVAAECSSWLADEPSLGASSVALLPPGDDGWVCREIAASLDADPAFEGSPVRHGSPCETGALARMESHPLVASALARWGRGTGARLAARLTEAASLVAGLGREGPPRHGARRLEGASAIAWVETARGLLVHRVALDGERIASWRIVAPTEWNFHPQGAFASGALGLVAGSGDGLRDKAVRLAASLDPCVALRCEVGHA